MAKKTLGVTIEENLLEKAKNRIPNISEFIENCFKNYLGEGEGLINTYSQHELVETIGKCQLELYLLNEKQNIEENMKQAEIEDKNLTWRKLFAEYRDTRKINPEKLEDAVNKLGVPRQELVDIVEVLFVNHNELNIDITDWFEVYGEFNGNE